MITDLEYALMAGRAYQTNRNAINWLSAPTGWAEFFHVPNSPLFTPSSSGFEAVSFSRGTGANKEIVISFAGTDGLFTVDNFTNFGLATGFGAAQLNDAAAYYLKVRHDNPDATITFTGHSLGGGLAALMGVFFGQRAVTFDQAPFAKSAELSALHPDVAANLKTYLLGQSYSVGDLTGLTNFIQERQAIGGIPNSTFIKTFRVAGEFTSSTVPFSTFSAIGTASPLTHGPANWFGSSFDLHAQSLLTTFIQNDQFRQVTSKLTDLLAMIFDSNLYYHDPNNIANPERNFLENLVRHQNGNAPGVTTSDAMLTRFTSDLWKLAQEGGLTMADDAFASVKLVSQTLIAFAMQKYYTETQASAGYNQELFTELGAGSSGGIRFDLANVTSSPLSATKGYSLYFHNYLANSFSPSDRDWIENLLTSTSIRDWYVQAGRSGMNATDTQNRGASMLGGRSADSLTGGAGNDLLVGNTGHDRLTGGVGTDTLLGGAGFDRYYWNTNDGNDRIEDSDADGAIFVNGHLLLGGMKKAGHTDWTSPDGTLTYEMSGTDLVVKLSSTTILTVNENFQSGQFGIRLRDLPGEAEDDGVTGATGRTEFLKIDHYEQVGTDANGDPIVEPVYGSFFDDNANDSRSNELTVPINGENNVIDALGGNDIIFTLAGIDTIHGGQGNDQIYAGAGNDYLHGDEGEDTLVGDIGDDKLYGGADDDTLEGGVGQDWLYGGEGNDIQRGGDGNDQLLGEAGDDTLVGNNGDDRLEGGEGSDWLAGDTPGSPLLAGGDDALYGGAGDDNLIGGGGNDMLFGGDGNDHLWSDDSAYQVALPASGHDWLEGGAGNDQLQAGAGDDVLFGGTGDDILYGDGPNNTNAIWDASADGQDTLDGGDGNDELQGGGNDDILAGGAGNDRLFGDSAYPAGVVGNDVLDGGAGLDYLEGMGGDDILMGGTEDDVLIGDSLTVTPGGDDVLEGGSGNDQLLGGGGADALFGEDGNDILAGDFAGDPVGGADDLLEGGAGDDELYGGGGQDVLEGGLGNDLLIGDNGDDSLDGGEGIDDVQGREGDDFLAGGGGNDFLYGDGPDPTVLNLTGGNDVLDGEAGDDQLWGGAGHDELFGGDGADQLVGDVGNDELYGEAGDDLLVGDSPFFPDQAGTDSLYGGDGNDVLQGGGGNDYLEGGTGNDTLNGGNGTDIYLFQLGDGTDTIVDFIGQGNRLVFGEGIASESVTLRFDTGDTLEIRVGNPGDAVRIASFGTVAPDTFHPIEIFEFADETILSYSQLVARGFQLFGTASDDNLVGTELADRIVAGAGNDVVLGGDGADTLLGEDGDDVLQGEAGDDILEGGAGNDRLYGSVGSNVLRGGDGNDVIESAGVGDQLFGGTGDDAYHLRSGSQIIVEEANAGTDTIYLTPAGALTFYAPDNVEHVRIEDDVFLDPALQVNMVGNVLDNVLSGSHRLDGQAGNDTLIGLGDNTFVFGRGYGYDTVQTGTQWYANTGLDQVEFLADITPSDFRVENHGSDLVLKINGTFDQLTVASYFISPSTTVDQFVFADGTVWSLADIESRMIFVGSDGNDTFLGTLGDDTIRGLGGNDQIRASAGNDILDGGAGNDFLEGGAGNDTYVFGLGYGGDLIDEQGDASDIDTLQLEGINPGDITLRATPDFMTDAILTINNTADQLTLAGFFASDWLRVDRFQFADGTVWDYNAMLAHTEGVILEGTEDQDFLYGNVTNDMLSGLGGDDILNGGAGDDTLLGGSGADQLTGSTGHDLLDGGTDADVMIGGSGNDVYVADNVSDVVTEQAGQGTDTVQSSLTYTLGANLENLTLTGTAAINGTGNALNNTLTGNSAANVLTGGTGNDTYIVGVGDTVVEQASSGTDTVQSAVSWTLGSNVENLTLTGTSAINGTGNMLNNSLTGNTGNNTLDGGAGTDAMSGGAGDDTYIVDNTADTVIENANAGIDTVQSSVTYTLSANVENLTLTGTTAINGTGNTLNNVLTGNSAANVLNGGAGVDTMAGGAGNDTYVVDNVGDVITENVGGGTDLVQSAVTYALGAEVENLTLTGTLAINGTGNTLNNSLTGNTGNNMLDGGAGADAMTGGTGNDTYIVDNTGDTVTEAASAGTDTVQSSITYTLGTNVENLTLTGTAAINGTGNTLNNTLVGNSAANTLSGGTGADTMVGGAGNDTYVVDNAGDTVTENANEGIDTVQSSLTYTLGANVENLTLTGTTAINGTGNALDNILTGNSAANVLTGGAGNDTYIVGTGDTVTEQANAGIDTVQSSLTYTLGANVENLTLTGTTAINGTGNALDNVLTGNSAANVLTGGAGNDTYVVGIGDTVTEAASAGTDTVQSAVAWNLGANLENLTLIGTAAVNGTGNTSNNILAGNSANNTLSGLGGNDTYLYGRGGGQDTVIENSGTSDTMTFGATINPLDLVLTRQVNNLRLAIHGSTDSVTIQNWYTSPTTNQIEDLQAGNGQHLLNTKVDQLIQAMASFGQQTGLTWDQAIDQRPQDVQTILAANWQ